MFQIALMVLLLILIVITALYRVGDGSLFCFEVFILITWVFCFSYSSLCYKQHYNLFVSQQQYIETHVPKTEVEDAALTQKKIEYNEWLYNAKWQRNIFGDFSIVDKSILDLKPIE
jgi:hypothetical protein